MYKYKRNILIAVLLVFSAFTISNTFTANAETINKKGVVRGEKNDNVKVEKDISDKYIKQKNIVLDNSFISLKLDQKVFANSKNYDVYVDNNKSEYLFENEMLVGYVKNVDLSEEKIKMSKEQFKNKKLSNSTNPYQDIANATALNLLPNGYSLSDYELKSVKFVDSYNEFVYNYVKHIGRYESNDSITIGIDLNGNVTSTLILDIGKYDNIDVSSIDEEDLNKFIKSNMARLHGNAEYEVENMVITTYDSKSVINIYIRYSENGTAGETFSYYI